jgi:hypothetical protein
MQVRPVSGLGKQRPCPEHVTLSLQNIVRMGPYHSAEHLQVRISANGDPGSGSKPLISVHWPCPLQALLRPHAVAAAACRVVSGAHLPIQSS